ncbi:MAG: Uma2 family endonuclease [Bacteroidia bacterium]|nr:Uma2 family endonuclease [Bacteroidia bacterium]
MAEKAIDTYTLEAYLELENSSEEKYEFVNGLIRLMAGGSPTHGLLGANFITSINIGFRENKRPCNTFSSDTRVSVSAANGRFYPDFSVICGQVELDEKDSNSITNPVLLGEILSDSTESYDRGEKFHSYQLIKTLKDYVLVNQNKYLVEVFSRDEKGLWSIRYYSSLEEMIYFPGINVQVSMEDIYLGIDLTNQKLGLT